MSETNSPIRQTGIGLEEETLLRCDRLRFCYGKSRSYVIERALTSGGLAALETEMAEDIERFGSLAAMWTARRTASRPAGARKDWRGYVAHLVATYGAKTYPPTVAKLEDMAGVKRAPAETGYEREVREAAESAMPQTVKAVRGLRDLS